MHAKVSPAGLRFFAHDPDSPTCALAGESMEHHLLKLQLASSVRAAGFVAELEVRAPAGSWRADVLATAPDGSRRMAWEAQLSPITASEIGTRTARFAMDDVAVCWVAVHRRPWLGTVPSLLVSPPRGQHDDWNVVAGLARFERGHWLPANASLGDAVRWVLSKRVVAHRFAGPQLLESETFWPAAWTAPRYVADAVAFADAQQRQRQQHALQQFRDQTPVRRSISFPPPSVVPDTHRAAVMTWRKAVPKQQRQQMRDAVTWQVQPRFGPKLDFGHEDFAPCWGGGIPIRVDRTVVGLLRPKPELLADWSLLAGIIIFVATRADRAKVARTAPDGTQIVVLGIPVGP